MMNMKLCKKCQRQLSIGEFRRGTSPCRNCEREAARLYRQTEGYKKAQAKYRSSPKGKATARAREQRPEVKAVRLAYAKNEAGKESQHRYVQSPKGKKNAAKRQKKYRSTPKGREKARARDRKRGKLPYRKELRKKLRREQYARSLEYRQSELERHRTWANSSQGKEWYRQKEQRRRALALLTPNEIRLTNEEWQQIKKEAKGRCHYCGEKVKQLTMDHVMPLSKKGLHTKENIVAACQSCNSRKRDEIWPQDS